MVIGLNLIFKHRLMKKYFSTFILYLFIGKVALGQTLYPVNPNQDILHYTFNISISDTSKVINGKADIKFRIKDQQYLDLDLNNKNEGKGMIVDLILESTDTLKYSHSNNRLIIEPGTIEDTIIISIHYHGIPANGLVIDNNKFGDRAFFGDNYPDRARNWLPTVDHPSDKATVKWIINAPKHYMVIGSGKLKSVVENENGFTTTTWFEAVPISTKVMVFAAANFSVQQSGVVNGIPVSTWVYKQNEKEGFNDFAIAPKVLAYFDSLIAPYPYEKLAHVQSKTMYGGMENAGNIFYFEESVNGKVERETLIVHETIHQWFGNSVTEIDWSHAWLSEGFATYLTHAYIESRKGNKEFKKRLANDRERIIKYWHSNPLPVVNTKLVTYPNVERLRELLNTNTYQKGGWVLHMLRAELGDEAFWKAVRKYYNTYKNGIASTEDLRKVVEKVSRKDLGNFFDQWLYRDGHPQLEASWYYKKGNVYLTIRQKQDVPFTFPLELMFSGKHGEESVKVVVGLREETYVIKQKRPEIITLDPEVKLLFEGDKQLDNEK